MRPFRAFPPCHSQGPQEEDRRVKKFGGGSQESEEQRLEGRGVNRGREGSKSSFFSTEAENSSSTTKKINCYLFQHRGSGQRLSGPRKGTASAPRLRTAPSWFPRADFISARGPWTASQVTGSSCTLMGTEDGLRCLTLLEVCPSFNGFFNALFSR